MNSLQLAQAGAVLGVDVPEASIWLDPLALTSWRAGTLKPTYRRRVRAVHPDLRKHPDVPLAPSVEEREAQTKAVNRAYAVLNDAVETQLATLRSSPPRSHRGSQDEAAAHTEFHARARGFYANERPGTPIWPGSSPTWGRDGPRRTETEKEGKSRRRKK